MTLGKLVAKDAYLYSYANKYDIRVFKGNVYDDEEGSTFFVRELSREDRRKVRVNSQQGNIFNNSFWLRKKDHKKARQLFEEQACSLMKKCSDLKILYGRMNDAAKKEPREMW